MNGLEGVRVRVCVDHDNTFKNRQLSLLIPPTLIVTSSLSHITLACFSIAVPLLELLSSTFYALYFEIDTSFYAEQGSVMCMGVYSMSHTER